MPSTARASGPHADVRPGVAASPTTSVPPAQTLARQVLLGLSLILISFNLRPVFGSLSVTSASDDNLSAKSVLSAPRSYRQ